MDLLTPKMGLSNRYSVGGYRYPIEDPFWVWVPQWLPCWRQPKSTTNSGTGVCGIGVLYTSIRTSNWIWPALSSLHLGRLRVNLAQRLGPSI
jgi:hypothetical protein